MPQPELSPTDLATIRESLRLASQLLRVLVEQSDRDRTPGARACYHRWQRRIKDTTKRLPLS